MEVYGLRFTLLVVVVDVTQMGKGVYDSGLHKQDDIFWSVTIQIDEVQMAI